MPIAGIMTKDVHVARPDDTVSIGLQDVTNPGGPHSERP